MRTKLVRVGLVLALPFVACVAATRLASAACTNDVDCPTALCGGQVCQWGGVHMCVPAGTDPQGSDGWCTTDTDCKCMGEGARCVSPHCTFTLPGDGGGTPGSVDASRAELEASAPTEDAGAIAFVDASVFPGFDSSAPPIGPDAGPMGSTVSGGCAISAGGSSEPPWGLALACVAALTGHRRSARRGRIERLG
jgi:hypothetical protein